MWYGFTRYPTILERGFSSWLREGDSSRRDFDEIRNVCSQYFHGDDSPRSQTITVLMCSPVMVIDQVAASTCILFFLTILYPIKQTVGVSSRTDLFIQGVAKSIGAVMGAVTYYIIWMLGGFIVKFCTVVVLLVNQSLYTSIFFRMGFCESMFLLFFRGIISISFGTSNNPSIRKIACTSDLNYDVETVEEELNTSNESDRHGKDISADENQGQAKSNSFPSFTVRQANPVGEGGDITSDHTTSLVSDKEKVPAFRNFNSKHDDIMKIQLVSSNDGSMMSGYCGSITTKSSSSSYDNHLERTREKGNLSQEVIEDCDANFEIVPKNDCWILKHQLALPGSRGPKVISFTGEVYSARIDEDNAIEEGRNSTIRTEESMFPAIFQGIKQKMTAGFFSAMKDNSLTKWETNNEFSRSGTMSTAVSGGQSSLESKSPIMSCSKDDKSPLPVEISGEDESSHGQQGHAVLDDMTVSVNNDVLLQDAKRETAVLATINTRKGPRDKHPSPSTGVEIADVVTIVGEVESNRFQTVQYNDPCISKETQAMEEQVPAASPRNERSKASVLERLSVNPVSLLVNGITTRSDFVPSTSPRGKSEKEVPPPAYAVAMENATRHSILDRNCYSAVNESTYESFNTMAVGRGSTASRSRSEASLNEHRLHPIVQYLQGESCIPSHVILLNGVGSADEEDITLAGFDAFSSPVGSPMRSREGSPMSKARRGRRPAPGRLDLPAEPSIPDPNISSMSTQRCDQFVYFDTPPRRCLS